MLTIAYNSGEVPTAAAIDLTRQLMRQSDCDFAMISIHQSNHARNVGVSVTLNKKQDGTITESWDAIVINHPSKVEANKDQANNNKSWGVDTLSDA